MIQGAICAMTYYKHFIRDKYISVRVKYIIIIIARNVPKDYMKLQLLFFSKCYLWF